MYLVKLKGGYETILSMRLPKDLGPIVAIHWSGSNRNKLEQTETNWNKLEKTGTIRFVIIVKKYVYLPHNII